MNFLSNKRTNQQTQQNTDSNTTIKKTLMLPDTSSTNLIGLILGPKGSYLKKIEEESNSKIHLRGKGTNRESLLCKDPPYAIIISKTERDSIKAILLLEKIIKADEGLLQKIKEEQRMAAKVMIASSSMNNNTNNTNTSKQDKEKTMNINMNISMTDSDYKDNEEQYTQSEDLHNISPYGRPSQHSKKIVIPNDAVGIIIGKSGETIKKLISSTGCKIHIALKEIPSTSQVKKRNIFIEGENYSKAIEEIESIIEHHSKFKQKNYQIGDDNHIFQGPFSLLLLPDEYIGLIIGKNCETIEGLVTKTTSKVFIPNRNHKHYEEMLNVLKILSDGSSITYTGKPLFHILSDYYKSNLLEKEDFFENQHESTEYMTSNMDIRLNNMDDESTIMYDKSRYERFTYTKQQIMSVCNVKNIVAIESLLYKSTTIPNEKKERNERKRILEVGTDDDKCFFMLVDEIKKIIYTHEERMINKDSKDIPCYGVYEKEKDRNLYMNNNRFNNSNLRYGASNLIPNTNTNTQFKLQFPPLSYSNQYQTLPLQIQNIHNQNQSMLSFPYPNYPTYPNYPNYLNMQMTYKQSIPLKTSNKTHNFPNENNKKSINSNNSNDDSRK